MADRNRMTFAGRPFYMVPEAVRELIDRYYPLQHLRDVVPRSPALSHKNLLALALPEQPSIAPRLNDLWYPTGATRWACFRGLMTGTDLAIVSALCFAGAQSARQPFVLSVNGESIETPLYLLPPRPVSDVTGRAPGLDALYLVTLVDERYYWQCQSAGVVWCDDDSQSATWEDLIDRLAVVLNVTISRTGIEAEYGTPEPDSPLYSNHESAAALLEACAHNTGRVLGRYYDGTYALVRWAAADAFALGSGLGTTSQAGGIVLPFDSGVIDPARAAVMPRRVVVTFPRWVVGSGYEAPDPRYRGWVLDGYHLTHDVLLSAADLGPPYDALPTIDYTAYLHTTAKALFEAAGEGGVPTNNSDVQALAELLARDMYDRHMGQADFSYPGLYPDPHNGHDALFAWQGAGKPYTRLSRPPADWSPVEFQHGFGRLAIPADGPDDPTGAGCSGWGWFAALRASQCMRLTVVGDSADPITLTSDDGTTWTSEDTVAICGIEYTPTLTVDPTTKEVSFSLTTGGEGSGPPVGVAGMRDCAGCNYGVFAFSRYDLCPCADPLPGGPCANVVRVRLEHAPCSSMTASCDGGDEYEVPLPIYMRVTGEFAWLGCLTLYPTGPVGSLQFEIVYPLDAQPYDPAHPEIRASRIAFTATPGDGEWCCGIFEVHGYIAGEWEFTPPTWEAFGHGYATATCAAIDLDPLEWSDTVDVQDTSTVGQDYLLARGYSETGGSAVTVGESECPTGQLPGWAGPGWYCVRAAGSADPCEALELLEGDECDTGIEICSGPYEDEESAEAACAGATGDCAGQCFWTSVSDGGEGFLWMYFVVEGDCACECDPPSSTPTAAHQTAFTPCYEGEV